MNLELTSSKILTVLNIVIGMMMTFDDFNDIFFYGSLPCHPVLHVQFPSTLLQSEVLVISHRQV
jgi:hypothetical protein